MTIFVTILFWLLFGHALADFPFQGPYLSAAKRRHNPEGANGFWVCALSAHALIHAGMVALTMTLVGMGHGLPQLVALAIFFGMAEFTGHWLIDLSKCEGRIGMVPDQVLHFICKGAWAGIATLVVLA